MKKIIRTEKEDLAITMYQFENIKTIDEMIKNYKWFSIASGIKNSEKTLKLMKEIKRENLMSKVFRDRENNCLKIVY